MAETPRVVLVTGASAGIGRATADRLHGSGWTVAPSRYSRCSQRFAQTGS